MPDMCELFSFEKSKFYAEKLETKYPFLTCTILGRSYMGRGIFSFSLGCPSDSVVIVGGTGGKSSQTSLVLYRFLDKVCNSVYSGKEISGINFSALIKKFGITVVPCLNPDSAEIASGFERIPEIFGDCAEISDWNANSAGIDIDLNFSSDWRKEKMDSLEKNIIFSSHEGFPGNTKESEPETRAFVSLCRRRNFRSCLTLRNSDINMIYYRRKDRQPPPSAMMAKILASSCCFSASVKEMPACPSRWFCDEFSKPAFLIETEKQDCAEAVYQRLEEALVLMSVM